MKRKIGFLIFAASVAGIGFAQNNVAIDSKETSVASAKPQIESRRAEIEARRARLEAINNLPPEERREAMRVFSEEHRATMKNVPVSIEPEMTEAQVNALRAERLDRSIALLEKRLTGSVVEKPLDSEDILSTEKEVKNPDSKTVISKDFNISSVSVDAFESAIGKLSNDSYKYKLEILQLQRSLIGASREQQREAMVAWSESP